MKIGKDTIAAIVRLIEETGLFQISHFRRQPIGFGEEKALRELVSFVDIESEKMLSKGLSQILPEAGFYGEESGFSGNRDLCWIVDPLDGTSNYLSGLDHFSISIGLVEKGKTIAAAIYRPASQELFTALKGAGLYRNGKKMTPFQGQFALKDALVGTGFPYRSKDLRPAFFECADDMLNRCRGLRRFGSAALDLSYTASGFFQAFWESDLEPYDVAAGVLFLEEQGLICSDHKGGEYDIFKSRILVAALPQVHAEVLNCVNTAYATYID
jgi:myo-inositol-1(or 4)-monophosphatase